METVKKPAELVAFYTEESARKLAQSPKRILILGFLAGMFIAFGGQGFLLALSEWNSAIPIAGKLLGAAIFPIGLMLVVLAGTELYTGDCLLFAGLYRGRIKAAQLARFLLLVLVGNFLGSVFVALLVSSSQLVTPAVLAGLTKVAQGKTTLGFFGLFMRGVGCNLLVVATIWICAASQSFVGKLLAGWFPIFLFVFLGFEHIVANFYFLPLALLTGAISDVAGVLKNFAAVFLGNTVGGALIFIGLYTWAFRERP